MIGPFYMNLAMILEDMGIPYIVTDYMGFDWSDISRVDDNVRWENMVEVRPPMTEFNEAVVDFFVLNGWESAIMIMPENPTDNQGSYTLTDGVNGYEMPTDNLGKFGVIREWNTPRMYVRCIMHRT